MTQLGEEWRRREAQRQQLLHQKLDHYTSLEKQLLEGLEQLQTQQKLLQERERKVCLSLVWGRERNVLGMGVGERKVCLREGEEGVFELGVWEVGGGGGRGRCVWEGVGVWEVGVCV
jgi:hypothetical protein